jgi:hypothetical protein
MQNDCRVLISVSLVPSETVKERRFDLDVFGNKASVRQDLLVASPEALKKLVHIYGLLDICLALASRADRYGHNYQAAWPSLKTSSK